MASIKNIENLTDEELNKEIELGAKFVMFRFCISVILLTFRRSSEIYYIRSGESAFKHGIGYSVLTLFLGWWGIPWGPIYSIGSIYTNFTGGDDVTQAVLASMNQTKANM